MSPRAPLLFILGVGLGGSSAWFLVPRAPHASANASPAPVVATLPGWDGLGAPTPPPLSARVAADAIAAWLALPTTPGPRAAYAVRAESLRALLARLTDADFPRLLSGIQRLSDEARTDLRRLAFDTWTDHDPASAARWALAEGKDTRNLARQATQIWGRRDALAALAWACALADQELATDLASYIAGQVPAADLPRALALIAARGPAFRDALAADLFRPLSKTDPVAALQAFGPTMWRRDTEIWQLDNALAAWAARDLPAALAWMRAQPRNDSFANIVTRLGTDDASRARLGAALLADSTFPFRQASLGQLLSSWAEKSPAAALAWLDSIQDRDLRTHLIQKATRGYSPEHPEWNLPLLLALPESQQRDQNMAVTLGRWAALAPNDALAWIAAQPDPSIARAAPEVHAAILGALAAESPTDAVREWQSLQNPAARDAAIGPIAEAWGSIDPAAALQWGVAQPVSHNPRLNGWNQGALFRAWAAKDAPAALKWAEGQSDAKLRQNLIGSLGGDWSAQVPASRAADLYAQIQNPTLRSEMLASHVGRWLAQDRPAATAWLEKSAALTPEQAAALLAAK